MCFSFPIRLMRWDVAGRALEDALEGIHKYYKLQFECPPLLARAAYWRLTGALGKARADLEQVLSISRDCYMRLYEADAQLLLGHVALDDKRKAREKLKTTCTHFEQIGYKRLRQQAERIKNELDS